MTYLKHQKEKKKKLKDPINPELYSATAAIKIWTQNKDIFSDKQTLRESFARKPPLMDI
jgi:hypothetical protein